LYNWVEYCLVYYSRLQDKIIGVFVKSGLVIVMKNSLSLLFVIAAIMFAQSSSVTAEASGLFDGSEYFGDPIATMAGKGSKGSKGSTGCDKGSKGSKGGDCDDSPS
jgi:hypothetical protein